MQDRITYPEAGALVDRLMNAHKDQIRGGDTPELREITNTAYAELMQTLYRLTDRPPRPPEPEDDPMLPKKRRHV